MQKYVGFTCFRVSNGRTLPLEMHGDRAIQCYRSIGLELDKKQAKSLFEEKAKGIALQGDFKVKVSFYAEPLDFKFEVNKINPKEFLTVKLEQELENWPANNLLKNFDYTNRRSHLEKLPDVDECLYFKDENKILDATYSSFFALSGDKLHFGTNKSQQVLGIFRRRLISYAYKLGLSIVESDISLSDLESFDCAFLTNDVQRIRGIKEIVGSKSILFDLKKLSPMMKNVNDILSNEERELCQQNLF